MTARLLTALLGAALALAQSNPYDAHLKTYTDSGQFIGTILIAKDGQPLYQKSFGPAQAEWDIPNTPGTKFRIGSITKQFTAVAIFRLIEQGKLALTDPVKKHFPAAPATWDAITIHHLLSHTSGIPNYTDLPGFLTKDVLVPVKPADLIQKVQSLPLDFAPGSRYKYNNSGFVLLGIILEALTGQRYADHLRATIFEPLGMKETDYDNPSAVIKHRAAGYVRAGAQLQNAPYIDMSWPFSAGGLYSTTGDLLKWDQALYTDRLLAAASKQRLYQPSLSNYAYGWVTRQLGTHPVVDHGGGIQGFNTHIMRVLDERLVTIVLANMNTPAASQLALELTRLALGMKAKDTYEEITLAPEKLKDYEGLYPLAPNLVLTVRGQTAPLTVQASGQGRFPVFPYAPDKFFAKVTNAQLDFTRNATGQVDGLIFHQAGNDQKAPRQTTLVPPDRPELPLDPAKTPDYPGTYTIAGAPVTLTIAYTNNQLTAQITGQPALPIYRSGPEDFFYKVVDAQLKFTRNSSGQVEAIDFTQGPRQTRWLRQ